MPVCLFVFKVETMRQQEPAKAGGAYHNVRRCKWRRLFFKRVMRRPLAASEHSEVGTMNGEEPSQAEGSSGSQHPQLFDFSFQSE